MPKPLDEQYLTWLYARIGSTRADNPARTYWQLMHQLYSKEFVWLVPNDDNRIEDGKDLRIAFQHHGRMKRIEDGWMELGCSVLELLIALADRYAFESSESMRTCFWRMLDNLNLGHLTDEEYNKSSSTPRRVDDILDTFIWRTYRPDGTGGLFPLLNPEQDQREVEIWYQLCAYILERV